MIAILKLRWMKLRDDIKMIAVMGGMTLIMIAVFASINYTTEKTRIGFVDEDQSVLSSQVLEEIRKHEGYQVDTMTLDQAKTEVKNGDLSGAFYIEDGFEEAVATGQVLIHKMMVTENMGNMQMDNLFQSAINQAVQDQALTGAINQIVGQDASIVVKEFLDEHWTYKKPIEVEASSLTEAVSYDSAKHSVVGFSLFFAMFTIIFGIADVLVEKENHTWQRQLVSPISKISILSANLLVTFLIGFIQVSAMFLISRYIFKVDFQGSPITLISIIAAFVFCVTALGMFLSNFVGTMGQLSAISPVIITGSAMLGGCFWPLEIVTNKFMIALSTITPQRWAIGAIEKIVIHGSGFQDVTFNIAILTGMGLLYLLLGTYFLEKKSIPH